MDSIDNTHASLWTVDITHILGCGMYWLHISYVVVCTDNTHTWLWTLQRTHILDCGIYRLHTHSALGCTDYTHTKLAVQSTYMIWCMMWVVQITHILCWFSMLWTIYRTHILAYGLYRLYTYQVVGFAGSTYTRLMKHHNFDDN